MRRLLAWAKSPILDPEQTQPIPAAVPADARDLVLEARVEGAARIIREFMDGQSRLEVEDRNDEAADVLLEVMVALGLAPAAPRPSVPVIPGRSS